MPPPAASAGPGGWEEEEEMFLLGHGPKELLTAKYRRCKGFAKKDGRGFKIPQIFLSGDDSEVFSYSTS